MSGDDIETLRRMLDRDERHRVIAERNGMAEYEADCAASVRALRNEIAYQEKVQQTRLTPMTRKVRS